MQLKLFASTVVMLVGAIGLQTPLLLFSPTAAIGQSTRTCTEVTADAQNQLKSDRDLIIELRVDDLSRKYPDYPENRPNEYIWNLQGSAISDIFHSPQMMKSIATEVINACNSVGAVTFGRYGSGEAWRFGILPDGSIKPFECAEDFGFELRRDNPQSPPWGIQFCGL